MAPNFQTLLQKPAESIEKPKPWPAGTYHGIIKSREFKEANNDKKTPFCRLMLQPTAPGEDVDGEALQSALGTKTISDRQFRKDMWLSDDAQFRLVELADSCGIVKNGRSLGELIEELPNQSVIFSIIQKPTQDGSELFNEVTDVKGTANS